MLIGFGFRQNCGLKAKFRLDLTYLYLYPTSVLRDVDRQLVTVRPSPLGPFSCSSSCMALRNPEVALPSYRGSDSAVALENNISAV